MSALQGTDRKTEVVDLEQLWELSKMCSWRSHPEGVPATVQCHCLGCGRFCGYACAGHEREIRKAMTSRRASKWVECIHCSTRNKVELVPIT